VGVRSSLSNILGCVDEDTVSTVPTTKVGAGRSSTVHGVVETVGGAAPMMLSREDSIFEFQHEVDGMLDSTPAGAGELDLTDVSSWGITDVENLLDLHSCDAFSSLQQPLRPSKKMKGMLQPVSVWEDGETFWSPGIGAIGEQHSGGRSDKAEGEENLNPEVSGLKCTPIKVQVVPPSEENTPMSMYDGHGFLKGY
jgi:hypothetical protein